MVSRKRKSIICLTMGTVNLMLFLVKLYLAFSSNSISIYVDSLNSLADFFICLIALLGFCVAGIKPSETFPLGYGKTEEIVNFVLSVVILGTGLAFIYSSLQRFMYPIQVWYSVKYAVVLAATAFVKLIMGIVYFRLNKKSSSKVIHNLGIDSILDFLVSLCIVVSFTLTGIFGYAIDAVMGIIASIIIIISGAKSFRESLLKLIGKNDEKILEKAEEIVKSCDEVKRIGNINYLSYGEKNVFNMELEIKSASFEDILKIQNNLNEKFSKELNAEVFIRIKGA